ncbi:SDR family NAD(P)-dependent oxidoreductase, partial [Tahibacter harae]
AGALAAHYAAPAPVQPQAAAPAAVPRPLPLPLAAAPAADAPIAILGLAGRFPQARTVDEFWQLLAEGRDAVAALPPERLAWMDGAGLERLRLGVLPGVDEFDPLFFEISPREAELMDPRQRLLLQEAWNALEDAAQGSAALQRQRVGTFVGVEQGDYQFLVGAGGTLTGNHDGILASRLAYALDLQGPVLAINTACSSGLVALHQACQSLRAGDCDLAVAAAANLMLTAPLFLAMGQAGMLSPQGRCRAFDRHADGMVPGEAVVAVVLKPLAAALADGDPVRAVIRASGINYDGKTNGITAPSGAAQSRLVREVLARSGADARALGYIVTHGTGTRLGDPVEINALQEAVRDLGLAPQSVALTSTKPSVGHSFAASGLVSLACLVQALAHETIPPSLYCSEDSDYVDWSSSAFFVNKTARPWPRQSGRPRLGAVSAFGMSGTNAHVLVEEAPPAARAAPVLPSRVLLLSARSEAALVQRVQDLLAVLRRGDAAAAFAAIAHTLACGRVHAPHRCAVVAGSPDRAIHLLQALLAGEPTPHAFRGVAPREFRGQRVLAEYAGELIGRSQALAADPAGLLDTQLVLAELYCQGYALPWARTDGDAAPARIALPGYPFLRERYWSAPAAAAGVLSGPVLHPLLHANVSDLTEQRFRSRFSGAEPFFADHVIGGARVLPGMAGLEMARAAVQASLPAAAQRPLALALQDVVWLRPLIAAGDGVSTQIALQPQGSAVAFEIRSDGADGAPVLHCQGRAQAFDAAAPALDLAALRAACADASLSAADCYAVYAALGMDYGPSHRGLEQILRGERQVLARVRWPAALAAPDPAYVLHPGLLDAALQAALALSLDDSAAPGRAVMPFALAQASVWQALPPLSWVWLRDSADSTDTLRKLDIDICDEHGAVCVRLAGLAVRPLPAAAAADDVLLFQPQWRELAAPAATAAAPRQVLLCGAPAGLAAAVQAATGDLCQAVPAQGDPAADYTAAAAALLALLQQILAARPQSPVRVQVVVTDAASEAGLAALLLTAQQEQPLLQGQVLRVAALTQDAVLAALALAGRAGLGMLRSEGGAAQQRVWQELAPAAAAPSPWKSGGVYLISGGAGGLGLLLAAQIARRAEGVRLVLCGRSALTASQSAQLQALRDCGAQVDYHAVDVTSAAAVETLIDTLLLQHGSLNGVIHAAGLTRDGYLLHKREADLAAVLAPKVAGVINLDRATAPLALDFFVAYSSVAGALGNVGQADYAAANGYLDGYLALRSQLARSGRRHGRSLSLNWPLWREGGMQVDAATAAALAQRGASLLDSGAGLAALEQALNSRADQVLVLSGNAALLRAQVLAAAAPAAPVSAPAAAAPAAGGELPLADVIAYLKQLLAATFKLAPERIDADAPLQAYGIDSLMVTELNTVLEREFGALSKTLFFEYQTLRAVAEYFQRQQAPRLHALIGTPQGSAAPLRAAAAAPSRSAPAVPA